MKNMNYPCANPLTQLCMIPREKLHLSFCPFHKTLASIDDYENWGYEELCDFFVNNENAKTIREKFLAGDFIGAGCPESCECMRAYRTGAANVNIEDYFKETGEFEFKKANLSMGPDCNIRCRYCLDTDNFEVDFGSCKAQFGDFIVPFVHNGGDLLLTGGEPFLPKWGLVKKLQELSQYDNNRGSIEIYTNATLLDDEACDAILKAPVKFIGISMDTYKPELFDYIRRGSIFNQVFSNAKKLLNKRDEARKEELNIRILCAVLKSTADHLEDTVNFYLNEGFDMSLNVLFKANFSPDFCERESLDTMKVEELHDVMEQLLRVEKKWGERVYTAAFKGQLQNAINKKEAGASAQQILGGGAYAKRKDGVNPEIKREVGKVSIFLSYHKDSEIVQSEVMKPIHVGAKSSKVRLDMLRDDTGDNISEKNDKYCELTAQYWAWKNEEADYYGFMHYRRHFAFRSINHPVEVGGIVRFRKIDERYRQILGLYDNEIYACLKDYDLILPTPVDTSNWGTISNEIQFTTLENLHAKEFDMVCNVVNELYPQYADTVKEYRQGSLSYWYNMFIMRKELFNDYCEWLFRVLNESEKRIDFTYFSEQEMRTLAFMAERLFSIYVLHLLKNKADLKVKHLKVVFAENTEKNEKIAPAFSENNIPIAVSCNEYYMPMLGVMLNSLLENGGEGNNYDILVMGNGIGQTEGAKRNISLLKKTVKRYGNASIRFIDISNLIGDKKFFVRGNFTVETYFRLFLPQVLSEYEKILYLDADMVVCADVSDLYNTDLEGAVLGAVRDPIISGSNKSTFYNKHDYMEKLGIKNIYDYFQAGVLVIDIKKISENCLCEEMIEYAATHDCDLVDQDVLNLFCQGKVHFIDNKWNVDVNSIAMKVVPYAPAQMWKEYQENRECAYIYHFAGADKPWKNPNLDKADIFWTAARKTLWYEVFVEDLIGTAAFFNRNVSAVSGKALSDISVWPDEVIEKTLPIVKAHVELSKIGLADKLSELLEVSDEEFNRLTSSRKVFFYGAGNYCKEILRFFDELAIDYPVEIWDKSAKENQRLFGIPVIRPDFAAMKGEKDALCVITIQSKSISDSVKQLFANEGFTNVIENKEIMSVLARKLWMRLEK